VWIALLLGLGGLVVFEQRKPQLAAIVDAVPTRSVQAPSAESNRDASPGAQVIFAIRPRSAPGDVDDAFPVRNWNPPPPPQRAASVPVPAPSAPPLPYTVFGKKLEDGQWQVFLRRENRILIVKSSDTIDDAYRIDEIRPPIMALTYLPLQQKQTLAIGGAE